MRKQTKIAALVSATALLALGASITSFAAARGTWMLVDGEWYCYDSNGDPYEDTFCVSNGKDYYVGEDGMLVRSSWVDYDGDMYFVNSAGQKITSDWRLTTPYDDEDAEEEWYYFQASGKMATNKKIVYKGNTDFFNADGKMLTGRDAAHKRIADMLARGEKLPVDFTNRVIYYVGPVDPVRDEVVGPAGPTTSTRMDKFTEMMLGQTGLIAMIGKAERGPVAIEAIKKHRSAYMIAVGGAAYLVAQAIRKARVLAFADLGMEAIYEFEVKDMPVTVAVDAKGTSLHTTGPAEWAIKIAARHNDTAATKA